MRRGCGSLRGSSCCQLIGNHLVWLHTNLKHHHILDQNKLSSSKCSQPAHNESTETLSCFAASPPRFMFRLRLPTRTPSRFHWISNSRTSHNIAFLGSDRFSCLILEGLLQARPGSFFCISRATADRFTSRTYRPPSAPSDRHTVPI